MDADSGGRCSRSSVEIARGLPDLTRSVQWASFSETPTVDVPSEVRNVLRSQSSQSYSTPSNQSALYTLETPRRRLFLSPRTRDNTYSPNNGSSPHSPTNLAIPQTFSVEPASPFDGHEDAIQLLDDMSIRFNDEDQTLVFELTPSNPSDFGDALRILTPPTPIVDGKVP